MLALIVSRALFHGLEKFVGKRFHNECDLRLFCRLAVSNGGENGDCRGQKHGRFKTSKNVEAHNEMEVEDNVCSGP